MIGLCFSYLQGVRFQNMPLLLSGVQSCQVGSSWCVSGISKPWLCPPHPSPLHMRANLGLVCSSWDGDWGEERIQYGLKILILNCGMVWRGQMTAVTIAMMSRDPLSPLWQSWPVHLGPPKCFQAFWGYWKFWPLAWNIEMQRENCKINFRYYLFSKNTTSLPVTVLGCWFREAFTACRWVLVLPPDPCPLNIQLLVSACSRQRGRMRFGQSWWRQGEFLPWMVFTCPG